MVKSKVTRTTSNPKDLGPTMPVSECINGSKPRKAQSHNPDPTMDAPEPGKLSSNGQSHIDVAQTVKELVRLAQEQGYLTYNDINEALPDTPAPPEELDEIYVKLRNLEVEIVDQAEVDRVKQPDSDADDEKGRLDILEDPVRMYL